MSHPKTEKSDLGHPKRVTLQDIANAAGVHIMTVSNALSSTRSVAPETRARVLRIARELNYVPNSAARALATGRTGLIAILSGPTNEPYYGTMVSLVEECLNADGYKLVLMRTPYDVKGLIDATGNTKVDGAIAIDMHSVVEEFRRHSAIPCVAIGTFHRTFVDCVTVDLTGAVEAALKMMLAAGRQRITYLATVHYMASEEESRARTYIATMKRAGREPNIINVNTGIFNEVGPRLKRHIKKNGCPDALLCQNDETTMCAYRTLRELGFRVPEDVLLVGCDGQIHMKYFDTPLSTIIQPMQETCATAWRFLKQRLANPSLPLQHATLAGELVVRESLRAS